MTTQGAHTAGHEAIELIKALMRDSIGPRSGSAYRYIDGAWIDQARALLARIEEQSK